MGQWGGRKEREWGSREWREWGGKEGRGCGGREGRGWGIGVVGGGVGAVERQLSSSSLFCGEIWPQHQAIRLHLLLSWNYIYQQNRTSHPPYRDINTG
jgi:hypothetical protein